MSSPIKIAHCSSPINALDIGPFISSPMVAPTELVMPSIRAANFTAWLGPVSKQISAGDRTSRPHIEARQSLLCEHCSSRGPEPYLNAKLSQARLRSQIGTSVQAASLKCIVVALASKTSHAWPGACSQRSMIRRQFLRAGLHIQSGVRERPRLRDGKHECRHPEKRTVRAPCEALHDKSLRLATFGPVLADMEKFTGVEARRIHVDKRLPRPRPPHRLRVWISGQVLGVTLPSAAGYNFGQLLRGLAELLRALRRNCASSKARLDRRSSAFFTASPQNAKCST